MDVSDDNTESRTIDDSETIGEATDKPNTKKASKHQGYYIKHREKILARCKERYIHNKSQPDAVEKCACGVTVMRRSMPKHVVSVRHIRLLAEKEAADAGQELDFLIDTETY
jgi:hypothetical protein